MEETQGAALPLAYMGGAAAIGAFYNVGNYASNVPRNQRTFKGFVTAAGSGAVGGAITATPIGAIRSAVIGGGVVLGGGHYANKFRR